MRWVELLHYLCTSFTSLQTIINNDCIVVGIALRYFKLMKIKNTKSILMWNIPLKTSSLVIFHPFWLVCKPDPCLSLEPVWQKTGYSHHDHHSLCRRWTDTLLNACLIDMLLSLLICIYIYIYMYIYVAPKFAVYGTFLFRDVDTFTPFYILYSFAVPIFSLRSISLCSPANGNLRLVNAFPPAMYPRG